MSDTPPADPPPDNPPADNPDEPAGVPEGTVLETTTHDGQQIRERIVNDTDENSNVIGWHKEPVPEGGQ